MSAAAMNAAFMTRYIKTASEAINAAAFLRLSSSVKSDVLKIHEDKKITMNDMPIMCNIVVNSMSYIKTFSQTEKIAQTLDQEATKYIVFGIMYFVFLEVNASEADLVAFTLMFDTLWQMISFDPKELILSVNNSCCCKKQ